MRTILGLNFNHADSSVCLIKNGKLEYAVEEERINRVKHWSGVPYEAIKEALRYSKTDLGDITDITVNANPLSNFGYKSIYALKNYLFGKKKYEILDRLKKKINIKNKINSHFFPSSLNSKVKFHYIDHHLSHIASAFYPSGFKDAVGLSIDGFGDFASICIAKCENDKIQIIKRILFPHSLGVFFESFTQMIGFKNYGDEYKMMGLSSYGEPKFVDLILNNIFKSENKLELNLKYFNHTDNNFSYNFEGKPNQNDLFSKELENLFNINELTTEIITDTHKNIAASAQKVFEIKLIEICKTIEKMKISKNLVYAGGCALNSLANRKIEQSNLFENIFIPYAPGDGGGSIGSALYYYKKKNKKSIVKNLKNPFIGSSYSNEDIKKIINKTKKLNNFHCTYHYNKDDLLKEISNSIFQNKIIGYFNGRMEFGARALGNRSILANPCNPEIKSIINKKIKRRENFRPFAPSILYEKKNLWFENKKENSYMSTVEKIREEKQSIIPAVTHIDGTGRVQTVTKSDNEDFYNLIYYFERISNVPIILNTSFNENEPIVMKPIDAINCFLRTDMDILVLNNFMIRR